MSDLFAPIAGFAPEAVTPNAPAPGTAPDSIAFLCDCGPIIRDLIDLDALTTDVAALPGVAKVERHVTLC